MTAIVVLAKEPRPGRVKTRLCPPLTAVQAAAVAGAALDTTLRVVRSVRACRRVLVLDGRPGPWARDFQVIPQRAGDHASRIAGAFQDAGCPALLIGMDTPQASRRLLERALATLHTPGVDAVLGPATDGGWWALGLHGPDHQVFAGVPMSRPDTGRLQLARLQELGLRTALLPELRDVDVFSDALEVAAHAPETPFARAVGALDATPVH